MLDFVARWTAIIILGFTAIIGAFGVVYPAPSTDIFAAVLRSTGDLYPKIGLIDIRRGVVLRKSIPAYDNFGGSVTLYAWENKIDALIFRGSRLSLDVFISLNYFNVTNGRVQRIYQRTLAGRSAENPDLKVSRSPDGRKLTYRNPENDGIYLVDLETGDSQFITNNTFAESTSTDWSSDGQQVAFSFGKKLVIIDADGENRREYDIDVTSPDYAAWMPNNRYIVLGTSRVATVIDSITGEVVDPLSELNLEADAWSCDGRWLKFLSANNQLSLYDMVTGAKKTVMSYINAPDQFDISAHWAMCDQLMVLTVTLGLPDTRTFYVIDPTTNEATLGANGLIAPLFMGDSDLLGYQKISNYNTFEVYLYNQDSEDTLLMKYTSVIQQTDDLFWTEQFQHVIYPDYALLPRMPRLAVREVGESVPRYLTRPNEEVSELIRVK